MKKNREALMTHAILIMAPKDVGHVCKLAQFFDRRCQIFVHFDKKCPLNYDDYTALNSIPQVRKVTQEYSVNWGGTSILECEMFLLAESLKYCDADYFHLISGQDYPIRPLQKFLGNFSTSYTKKIYPFGN